MKTKRVFQIAQGACLAALVFFLALSVPMIPASAAESHIWDESCTGSITIQKYVESDYLDSGENLSQEEIAAYLQAHPDDLTPLPGVIFHVRAVAEAAQYVSDGTVSIGYALEPEAAEFLDLNEQAAATIQDGTAFYDIAVLNGALARKSVLETEKFMADAQALAPTDASGQSTVTDLDVGSLYLFCEYSYPSTALADEDHCAPFLVSMPSTDRTADGSVFWDYDITVAPKNMIQPIRNDLVIVGQSGDETDELDAETYEPTQFLARSEVPNAVGKIDTYKVEIIPSNGITVLPETILVYGVADDGTRKLLTEENGDLSIDLPTYTFTPSALADGEGWTKYDSVEIYYKAQLNEDAVIGSEGNPTTMRTEYTTSTNGGQEVESMVPHEDVRLFTFAIDVSKVGSDTKQGMPDVAFALQAEGGTAIHVRRLEDGVYILDDAGTDTLTTASDGSLRILGAEASSYYLKELATGNPLYNLLSNRIKIQIQSNEFQYEQSTAGTFFPANTPERYFTDALPERNYFLLPLASDSSSTVSDGTYVCAGTNRVMTEPDGHDVKLYTVTPLSWRSNYAMGGRDSGTDSGVVSLEVVNSRISLAPKTGDGSILHFWVVCLLVASGGLVLVILGLKKEDNTKQRKEK